MTSRFILSLVFVCTLINNFSYSQSQWMYIQGSDGVDIIHKVLIDSEDNVYTIGEFENTMDFDPSVNTLTTNNPLGSNTKCVFIHKTDKNKNLIWVKLLGNLDIKGAKIDNSDNIYLFGGITGYCDMDPGLDEYLIQSSNSSDGFISKFDKNGNLNWAKTITGYDIQYVSDVDIDASKNVYLIGTFRGNVDLDPGTGIVNYVFSGFYNGMNTFYAKWNENGEYIWSDVFQSDDCYGQKIQIDLQNNIYLIGQFFSEMTINTNLNQETIQSQYFNQYIVKIDLNRNLLWFKNSVNSTDPSNGNYGSAFVSNSTAIDNANNLIISGVFRGSFDLDYNSSINSIISSLTTYTDCFIQKVSQNGDAIKLKTFGGIYTDEINDFVINSNNEIFVVGNYQDYITLLINGEYEGFNANTTNLFLIKYDENFEITYFKEFRGYHNCSIVSGKSIELDSDESIYLGGYTFNPILFDIDNTIYSVNNEEDCLLIKLNSSLELNEKNNKFSIFPNPSSDFIHINSNSEINLIEIFDLNGNLIHKTNSSNIDIREFSSKFYIIRITSENETYQYKLCKY